MRVHNNNYYILSKKRHPYETRLRIRERLPWILINIGLCGKGKDCEKVGAKHKWYNIDNENFGCYYCRQIKRVK